MPSALAALFLMALPLAPLAAADEAAKPVVLGDECVTPADWAPPFTRTYRLKNGATLVFVAVDHTRDGTSPTFQAIKAAFAAAKPDVVLVEGASSAESAKPDYLKFLTDAANQQTAHGIVSENLYAVKLASDAGIAFSGWDFRPDHEYAISTAKGYAVNDVIAMHLMRGHVDPFAPDIQRPVSREIGYAMRITKVEGFDYPAWYRQHYGAVFDVANGTPCGRGLAAEIDRFESDSRNQNLAALIGRYAVAGKTLLVEAGANHWLALKPYLESLSRAP